MVLLRFVSQERFVIELKFQRSPRPCFAIALHGSRNARALIGHICDELAPGKVVSRCWSSVQEEHATVCQRNWNRQQPSYDNNPASVLNLHCGDVTIHLRTNII